MSSSTQLDSIEHDIDKTRTRIDRTLDALTEKLSASRIVGEAMDSVRQNGGMFAGNLVHTVRDNPVPSALLATGLAWLMVSDRRGQHAPETHRADDRYPPSRYGDPMQSPDYTTAAAPGYPVAGAGSIPTASSGTTTGATGTSATDRARSVAGTASQAASSAAHKAGDGMHKAGDAARDAAARVGDTAARAKSAAGDTVASARAAAHDLRDRAGDAAHGLRDRVGEAGGRAGQRVADAYAGARDATRRAGNFLSENPLMIGALGLAIGGIVAAALPASRREDEWFGETGERIRGEAAAAARQVAEAGAGVAEAAADAAVDEAKRRNLTPEDAGQVAEKAVRGGTEVAKSAVRAAEEEARRRTGNGAPQAH